MAALTSAQRTPQAIARLPSDAALRRALAQLEVDILEQALMVFQPLTPALAPPSDTLQGVAIDGKAIRGVGRDGHPCHLVALVQHADARVLGQVAVALKRDKRSAVPALLASVI